MKFDTSLSLSAIDEKISKVFDRLRNSLLKEGNSVQNSSLVSDLAREQVPIGIKFLDSKFKSLIGYLLVLHYYPCSESVRCYMILDLEEFFFETESFWLSVLLKKELFLKYLQVQETISTQQFFAGICNEKNLKEFLHWIVLRFEGKLRTPRRPVWRKGYRDKGTLPDYSKSVRNSELNKDYYFSALQLQIEERRLQKSALCSSLEKFLVEGRVLTDEEKMLFRIIKNQGGNHGYFGKTDIEDYIESRDATIHRKEDRESSESEENSGE